jgi:aspartate carbamoyltransferase catalytic subunit
MKLRHFISSLQFTRPELESFFLNAQAIDRLLKTGGLAARKELHERLALFQACSFFYEPSTRTRCSFESAANRLGMSVVSTENAAEFSSTSKGETLEDSTAVLGGLGFDVLIMRHKETGAAERAAKVCNLHGLPMGVVNGGDGTGEHPSQSLLDLYTIWKEKADRGIDGLTVVIGGDLKHGRTVRSLALMLSLFKTKIIFVAPEHFEVQSGVKSGLEGRGIEFREETDPAKALPEADVVYWTRVQRERIADPALLSGLDLSKYVISAETLGTMKPDVTIMHPLPRVGEITTDVDCHPGAAYFRQAWNGLPVRMALLERICLGK